MIREINRAVLTEFCDKFCNHEPHLIATAQAMFYCCNQAIEVERYRWLREACETKEDWGWLIRDTDADVVLKLDAAIDDAIAKENGK